ncbi:hypothetical protein FX988_00651 [Paraglaciecola mesophila]|uniref:DUF7281 domain-containing protein n=1 Tax=Paraglaciecola mesophila TaxID=197222 RepID=A0A857JEI4_9ALTE|nr:hypothetical protein [Paraglaciecola mesophila]QHJ10439.1 hypothetical protein FX988_00651 [Paraglaciecola mesophila]
MPDVLMTKAKSLLKEQYFALLLDEQAYTSKIATVSHILRWCEQEYIQPGQWLTHKKRYRFTRTGIDAIRDTYLMSMGEDIFADFSQDTHQSAAAKSTDEKQGVIKPTQSLVLIALTDTTPEQRRTETLRGFRQQFYASSQVNVELDITRLNLQDFDNLLVIENRDSFNDWHVFEKTMQQSLKKLLVIYRGDSVYSSGASALLTRWQQTRPGNPCIYFGDFDLAGLRIACSGGYSQLLLPSENWLITNLIKQHYPDEQRKFEANLLTSCPKPWEPLLSLMCEQQAGLRQQWMYQQTLVLY